MYRHRRKRRRHPWRTSGLLAAVGNKGAAAVAWPRPTGFWRALPRFARPKKISSISPGLSRSSPNRPRHGSRICRHETDAAASAPWRYHIGPGPPSSGMAEPHVFYTRGVLPGRFTKHSLGKALAVFTGNLLPKNGTWEAPGKPKGGDSAPNILGPAANGASPCRGSLAPFIGLSWSP